VSVAPDSAKAHWSWLPVPTALVAATMLIHQDAWMAMVGFHLLMLAALIIYRRSINWRKCFALPSARLLLGHLTAAVLMTTTFSIVIYAYAAGHDGYGEWFAGRLNDHDVYPATRLLFALQLCLLNPLLEELFWRGLFFSDRRRLAATDFCYAAFHIFALLPFMPAAQAAVGTVGLVGFGYVLRQLVRSKNGSLILPLLWHALADIAVVVAIARLTG
jgi:membrane protease YdiL (CAAX protease family)